MTLTERIEAFSTLGDKIKDLSTKEVQNLSQRAKMNNQWFTEEHVKMALDGIAFMLQKDKLSQWTENYKSLSPDVPKIVGIIMAGNIPMVGFHDLLCVLISGHFAAIKTSSQDSFLIETLTNWITDIEPRLKRNFEIRERLTSIDVLIATGSDNTSRYFEYYFKDHPKIIRKNRTSVAILDGTESDAELTKLGLDIFSYFGLGCRNVSKLFVPQNYDPKKFFEAIECYKNIADNHKYQNNYEYHKSILLVNGTRHLDNGFLLWQTSDQLVSPISVLFNESYSSAEDLKVKLATHKDKLQCIVGKDHIPFGQAQSPELWDYADNVDTLKFLESLN